MSKGSWYRPVNQDIYAANYEQIFKKEDNGSTTCTVKTARDHDEAPVQTTVTSIKPPTSCGCPHPKEIHNGEVDECRAG